MSNIVKNILYGGPDPSEMLPLPNSFGEFCINKLEQHGNRVLIVNGLTSEETTAYQLLSQSICVAEALLHYGIEVNDIIGICSENSVDYLSVIFGAFFIGAAVAPVCITLTEGELSHMFNISRPKMLFTMSSLIGIIAKGVKEKCPSIRDIIVFDQECDASYYRSFKSFINNENITPSNTFTCKPQHIKETLAIIAASSGTTGLAKGIEITQFIMMSWLSEFDIFIEPMEEYTIPSVPFAAFFGSWSVIKLSLFGRKIVLLPKYDDNSYLTAIEKYNIRFLLAGPRIINLLAKNPIVDNYDLSGVKSILSVGGALTDRSIIGVRERLGIQNIIPSYGLSELGMIAIQNRHFRTLGSIGSLMPGVWLKVVDPETDSLLGPNKHGEFMFKKNSIMKGYFNNPEETKACIDRDGFFRSGDLGYYNENGELFVVDRIKEVFKYSGYHVSPTELETLLLTHQNVRDACVVGMPDDTYGNLPLAFIVKNGDITKTEIFNFVAERISDTKHLRGGIRFIAEIPRNAFGKQLRRVLRDSLKK